MNRKIFEIAAQAMHIPVENVQNHYKTVDGINAYYFWNPIRGGLAVIVSEEGEKLAATSSVSFEKHLQAFLDGKRN